MNTVKIKLNSDGVRELLKSQEMKTVLAGIAQTVASSAGTDYKTESKRMQTRVIAAVYIEGIEEVNREIEQKSLIKAVSK